jgi:ABC-type metal ion transport system, periplasmic component/surface adhesin
MDVIEIETDHDGEALSAGNLKETIKMMNEEGIKTIIIAKDADRSTAEAIASETGASVYELNTCMVGTNDSTADAYVTDMQENFDIISEAE